MSNPNNITIYQIISNLEHTSRSITDTWRIITSENILSKKYKVKRTADIEKLYAYVQASAIKRIEMKLDQLGANLGFTSRSALDKAGVKSDHYKMIFELSELREQLYWLSKIPTLTEEERNKKSIRRKHTEVLSKQFIDSESTRVTVAMNKIKQSLHDYNSNPFIMDVEYDLMAA